ncbi:MAG: hypothetical protein OEZ48_02375 [Candidatus Bathyarchaeota archaeon]|nr:hypothetical protein [Candidatus Bathyarchaeota archaeon]
MKTINPVFRIESWRSATVSMRVDDAALDDSAYQWQLTRSDLITWVDLEIEEERKLEITP